jgi:hypothetical protein
VEATTVKGTGGLVIPFKDAVMLAVPLAIPVAKPVEETVAVALVSLAQVT